MIQRPGSFQGHDPRDPGINSGSSPKTIGQAKIKFGEDLDEEYLHSKIKKERVHDMEAFKQLVKNLRVIARVRAIDKYALVLGLRF